MPKATGGLAAQREANARLTRGDVIKIRQLTREGHSPREISQMYNVGLETIRRVLRGDTWAWLIEGTETLGDVIASRGVEEAGMTVLDRFLKNNPDVLAAKPVLGRVVEKKDLTEGQSRAQEFGLEISDDTT